MKKLLILAGLCLLLTGCAAPQTQETTSQTEESTAQITEDLSGTELTVFTVYTPNETYDGFIATEVQGEKLTVLGALIDAGVLTDDVQVNYYAWEGTVVTADFNAAFRDLLNSQGTAGERMLMGCVVNTLLSANNAETVMITVDGETLESGHVVYDFPMEFFE